MLLALFCTSVAYAADYCSLTVRVLSPDGRRVHAVVSVEEQDGRKIERDPTAQDLAFCDLGILPVTVKVGADGTCNQVVVKDVPVSWQESYLLTVSYDLEPCLEDLPPSPAPVCSVLFRVSDSETRWLQGARVQFDGSTLTPRETDSAGRALVTMKLDEVVRASIGASGFDTKHVSVSCSRSLPLQEEIVRLSRKGGR